jgi:hypothetical protein
MSSKRKAAYSRALVKLRSLLHRKVETRELEETIQKPECGCFGVSLDDLMGPNVEKGLPLIFHDAVEAIACRSQIPKTVFGYYVHLPTIIKIIKVYQKGTPTLIEREVLFDSTPTSVGMVLMYFIASLPVPLLSDSTFFTASDRMEFTYICMCLYFKESGYRMTEKNRSGLGSALSNELDSLPDPSRALPFSFTCLSKTHGSTFTYF